jgi:hypothetical protein
MLSKCEKSRKVTPHEVWPTGSGEKVSSLKHLAEKTAAKLLRKCFYIFFQANKTKRNGIWQIIPFFNLSKEHVSGKPSYHNILKNWKDNNLKHGKRRNKLSF